MAIVRDRRDRCPGALRPWSADDGLLVRLRLIGGRVLSSQLRSLIDAAEVYGDGRVHLTRRANLQVRGFPGTGGRLAPEALAAIEATGLVPSRSHELVRNVMVSPESGLTGGRVDLRPVAAELDRLLSADERLAALPGRFLFVLDDGRGDLVDRGCDLGLVALDASTAQLRVGDGWGDVIAIDRAAGAITALAGVFLERRGNGADAPWHVAELPVPLAEDLPRDDRVPPASGPLPYDARHVAVPDGIDRTLFERLDAPEVIVTPWRGVLVPETTR